MTSDSVLWVAAPMVKVSSLPFRLTCLDMGADLVYSEEIIGERFFQAIRQENPHTHTVEFFLPNQKAPVFMTSPLEEDRVVLQLGVADATSALKTALVVWKDVNHLDINMGCPKRFSVNKGMGAKLLSCPENVEDILKTLKRNSPQAKRLSCKVRLKDRLQDTIDFVRCCEYSGADAVAIHTRRVQDSPSQPAQWNTFSTIKSSVQIPLYVNGDLLNSGSIHQFYKKYIFQRDGVHDGEASYSCPRDNQDSLIPDGLMLARGALWNPSIFKLKSHFCTFRTNPDTFLPTPMEGPEQSILRLLTHAENTATSSSTLKWCLLEMLCNEPRLAFLREDVTRATNLHTLKSIFQRCVDERQDSPLFPIHKRPKYGEDHKNKT